MSKSNIIGFRKGGYLAARETLTYNSTAVPVVNAYTNLGFRLFTKLRFTSACCDRTSKPKNASLSIMKELRLLNNNNLELFLKLFDSQVQPIVQYSAELWGLNTAADNVVLVHLHPIMMGSGLKSE